MCCLRPLGSSNSHVTSFPTVDKHFTECIADLDKLTLDCRDGFKHEYLKDTVSKYMLRVPQYL